MINICFHGVGSPTRALDPGEDRYWISHEVFQGVLDLVTGRIDVALSFDDGNASDVQLGLSALQDRGLTASFFVLAGRLGKPGFLSEADLASLTQAGMTVGTHGMDHISWRSLDEAEARRELVEAREVISRALPHQVTEAACPLGRYDRRLLRRLRKLGYSRVYTSDRSRARGDAWLQARYSVTAEDSVDTVQRQILSPPPPARRLRSAVAELVKRLR